MIIKRPNELVEILAQTARTESVPEMEILRRMFTVLRIMQEEKRKGNELGIVNGEKVISRFVGV